MVTLKKVKFFLEHVHLLSVVLNDVVVHVLQILSQVSVISQLAQLIILPFRFKHGLEPLLYIHWF